MLFFLANSVYGKIFTIKRKHQNVTYSSDQRKIPQIIFQSNLVFIQKLEHDFCENLTEKHK